MSTLEDIGTHFPALKGIYAVCGIIMSMKVCLLPQSHNPYFQLFLGKIILPYVNICSSLVNINFIDWVWIRLLLYIWEFNALKFQKISSYLHILLGSHWSSNKTNFFPLQKILSSVLDIFSHHNLRNVLLSLSFSVQMIEYWITQDCPNNNKLFSTQCHHNYNLESVK